MRVTDWMGFSSLFLKDSYPSLCTASRKEQAAPTAVSSSKATLKESKDCSASGEIHNFLTALRGVQRAHLD